MKKFDVLIIGGGAAGLTAALSAIRETKSVVIAEAAPRVGRKILASGNGRCNLCNTGVPRYYGGRKLAEKILEQKNAEQVLCFFRSLGLQTHEETGGRVYPACGQASAVLDTLRTAAEREGVQLLCDAPVKNLIKTRDGFSALTPQGEIAAKTVVAAFGGMAGGKLGHDGKPYELLTAFGHALCSPKPALTQLIAEKSVVKGLSGLRLPARLTLCDGKRPVSASCGEVLFTDYGVSGVCAMQLSREAGELLAQKKKTVLYIDFSPMLGLMPRIYDRTQPEEIEKNTGTVLACLMRRTHILPPADLLCGLLPRLLAEKVKNLSLEQTARMLSAFPVPIIGVKGFENAQVTAGGIDCRDFDETTLESRMVPGLFAAGELMDVDGDCGGFNLQFAFASGLIAGQNAGKTARR